MADAAYDWSTITATAVTRLRAPKIKPVPEAIAKLAQASYDGVEMVDESGEKFTAHVLRSDFGKGNEERAAEFAGHMKNAGNFTSPPTTVRVAVDPDNDGNNAVVAWQAGARRGRKAS